jgi:endo-1,4-beta-xylanase
MIKQTQLIFIDMRKYINRAVLLSLVAATVLTSCKKGPETDILNTGNFSDNGTALKDAADFPIGAAINYNPWNAEPKFSEVVKRDFDQVVCGYEMKHGAIVQNNGTYNFTNADALVTAAGTMDFFGHTLNWHQNQNATYLKAYSGITVPAATELATNPGFESGLTGWSVLNTGNPAGTSTITTTNVAAEVHGGTSAMKVVNPVGYPGSQWRVQVSSSAFPTTSGIQYAISYWVKAAAAGGSIRLSTGPSNAQYQGDQTIGTTWQQVTWTITANLASTTFLFDMGQAANTYYIDDVSVKEVVVPPGGPAIALKLDTAMGNFITTMVNRYKNKVHAWDVVNEPFADNPVAIRNNSNTSTTAADVLVWSNYMGRSWALKAFNYAKAADPTADLYINDYNLETNAAKLDSLIAFVSELKAAGAKIDGIGTQMHIGRTNMNFAGIDKMMQKLAATGLKIRISELDVKIMQGSSAAALTPELAAYQAEYYRYVVSAYLKYIPKVQQAGITVWGVDDKNSWIYNSGKEFPLLYDNDYNKKPAYGGFLKGLRGQ